MSWNDSPARTPSSLSRSKADIFGFDSVGLESILGKRKSEQPLPAGSKRRATTFPCEEEKPTEEVYDSPRPDSPSSTSDAGEHERLEHDRGADVSRGSFRPRPPYPLHGSSQFFHQLWRVHFLRFKLLMCPDLQILFHPSRRLVQAERLTSAILHLWAESTFSKPALSAEDNQFRPWDHRRILLRKL